MKKKVYLFLITSIVVFSCASKKQIMPETDSINKETITSVQNKILFLNYQIVKNEKEKKSITLINQINTKGKLKGKSVEIENTTYGDLEYAILDAELNILEKHVLKNPLKKTVEFINDFGNFEKKVLDLDTVQFHIRLQLPAKAKHIAISEFTNTKPIQHITTKIE
ncbi:hypothetical protein Q4512_12985 [Oceanihabitans sp. 2_MG-2023]|uniref:hypothetical protein n=1 Tax=Oceanihabitans sp. 2_MG-2023 TaxID=3062661 RepID=UPI0026E20893|nr:hypothetical protein [Oceanihabitans sp. 2_MG-2023]MDO6597833.1 hypothetical protein [Oceanihabitans sp. 2_MG-2023]